MLSRLDRTKRFPLQACFVGSASETRAADELFTYSRSVIFPTVESCIQTQPLSKLNSVQRVLCRGRRLSGELYPSFSASHVTVLKRVASPLWGKHPEQRLKGSSWRVQINGLWLAPLCVYMSKILLCDFLRYIQSLMEILEFLDKNPDDFKVLGE